MDLSELLLVILAFETRQMRRTQSCPVRTQREDAIYKPRREASGRTSPALLGPWIPGSRAGPQSLILHAGP